MHKNFLMLSQLKRVTKENYILLFLRAAVILLGSVLQPCTFDNYVIHTSLENIHSLSETQTCVHNVSKIHFVLCPTAAVLDLNRIYLKENLKSVAYSHSIMPSFKPSWKFGPMLMPVTSSIQLRRSSST